MNDLEPYLERLKDLPFVRRARVVKQQVAQAGLRADATVELRTTDGTALFLAEHKRTHLSNDLAERLLHIRTAHPNLLLLAPFVGRDLAERFARAGLNFVDLSGNCHIQIGDRFLAHVEGRRTTAKAHGERALRAQSYRVLFAMLVTPELTAATARALAKASGGVSPQTAIDTRARFVERGLLLETAKGATWAPRGWKDGLDVFVGGFTATLAPQLSIGRYRAKERDSRALEHTLQLRLSELGNVDWRWGGGAASARFTDYFRGDQTILYVKDPPPTLAKHLQLRPDTTGPVCLTTPPGPLAFEAPVAQCVHPLLAYVDLLAEGDERAREGAGEIYRRFLAPMERGQKK